MLKFGPSSVLMWLFTIGRTKDVLLLLITQTQCFTLSYQAIDLALNNRNNNDAMLPVLPTHASKPIGVTSLLNFQKEPPVKVNGTISNFSVYQVLAGTKCGDVAMVRFKLSYQEASAKHIATLSSLAPHDNNVTAPSHQMPIFCLEAAGDTLFVGGGDRFVSVWQRQRQSWARPLERLGPHTGWVRSIAHFHDRVHPRQEQHLYSIGCNRIVTWKRTSADVPLDSDNSNTWTQASTITVNSCPPTEAGGACTLSSDLLCLAPCTCQVSFQNYTGNKSVLAAGGVDGRIHFFWQGALDDNDGRLQKVCVVATHNGRINALKFDSEQQLLLSASHDGSVRCWTIIIVDRSHNFETTLPNLSVCLAASHTVSADSRVTALNCWKDIRNSSDLVTVAAGTHIGHVYVMSLRVWNSCEAEPGQIRRCYEFVVKDEAQISCNSSEGNSALKPTINALCPLKHVSGTCAKSPWSSTTIVVGHSHGLGFLSPAEGKMEKIIKANQQ